MVTLFSPKIVEFLKIIWQVVFWSMRTSPVAQTVKNLPAVQETLVQSLGWEDPLEEGRTTHSSILAWKIPWTEEPGGLQSMGSQRVRQDWSDLALMQWTTYLFPKWEKTESALYYQYCFCVYTVWEHVRNIKHNNQGLLYLLAQILLILNFS